MDRIPKAVAALLLLSSCTLSGCRRPPDRVEEPAAPVHYLVEILDPALGIFHVTMVLDARQGELVLTLPVATPGGPIQNHARFVSGLDARRADGSPLRTRRADPHSWGIEVGEAGALEVRYAVHRNEENELRLLTNWLSEEGGFFHGATLFLHSPDHAAAAAEVHFRIPETWTVASPLTAEPATRATATDYRELAFTPFELGPLQGEKLAVGDARFELFFAPALPAYDRSELQRRIRDIALHHQRVFGSATWGERYQVFFHWRPDLDYGGGVARRSAMVMNIGAEWMEDLPRNLSGTFAHELFHAWNFATFYPRDIATHDYRAGNPTRHLWLVEGLTNYYVLLTYLRAWDWPPESFLAALSGTLDAYEASPGRGVVGLEDASVASFIESVEWLDLNNGGLITAFLLDIAIRHQSGGRASLDDFVRALSEASQAPGYRGYDHADLERALNAVAGADLGDLLTTLVRDPGELDYATLLAPAGLTIGTGADGARRLHRLGDAPSEAAALFDALVSPSP